MLRTNESTQVIEIRRIHGSPRDIRFDTGTLDLLADSIKTTGLLQPIIVRRTDKGFEVVAGHRRFEACKSLGFESIPCRVMDLTDKEAFEISLVENVQRNTLNPIEEATAFKKYVDEFGYGGVSELSRKIGKTQEHVSKRLQLLKLPKRVQREIMRRRITPSAAYELCCVDSEYTEELAEKVLSQNLSLREVRRVAKTYKALQRVNEEEQAPFTGGKDALSHEGRERRIERGLKQCIMTLKVSMVEFDQTIGRLDDEWIVTEMLIQQRKLLHGQIDSLLHMRSKLHKSAFFDRFESDAE